MFLASKELAQTSYFMATNSLHLTTMCLRYPPTIVACVCIHLACIWSKYQIPVSGEVNYITSIFNKKVKVLFPIFHKTLTGVYISYETPHH